MKLRFTIHYGTQWGESVHVVIRYRSNDGTERLTNQPMLTQDGQTWTLETAAIESRHHRLDVITYHYQVEDADGRVLRREWSQVPRTYYFDASKSYVFCDQWRDLPLCAHLYSNAYLTTQHAAHGEQVEPRRVPLYRKTAVFRVSAPQLQAGQSLALLGSHPMIGGWSPVRYLRMEYIGQADWLVSVNLDAVGLPLEYKYVVVDDKTHELLMWEDGDNRVLNDELTDGEMNIMLGPVLRLWHDCREAAEANPSGADIPSAEALEEAYRHTDISPDVSVTMVIGSLRRIFSISVHVRMRRSTSDLSMSTTEPPLVRNEGASLSARSNNGTLAAGMLEFNPAIIFVTSLGSSCMPL